MFTNSLHAPPQTLTLLMEPYAFVEMHNELNAMGKLPLNTTREAQQSLSFITPHPKTIHNSKLAINRVIPDVLYEIFKLAIYNSTHPGKTALGISYVCRHWRRSALEWPALWGILDLNGSDPITDLFISRSENAPLTLSLSQPYRTLNSNLANYFESRANLILPRLVSLTIHLLSSELPKIQHVFQNTLLQPLRLRHLDISSEAGFGRARPPSLTDFLIIDMSCLRELKLQSISLPWLELPHNKLTHFTLRNPISPPTLSHLLGFLASCPSLSELEIVIWAHVDVKAESTASPSLVERLDFPNLQNLTLESRGLSYYYIHEISARIRTLGSLSQFRLCYPDYNPPDDQSDSTGHPPFNMFESVPSGALSHFSGHRYLYIDFELFRGSFQILSVLERDLTNRPTHLLHLSGTWHPNWVFDRSPMLELMHVMPKIMRLGLGYEAWGILSSWNINIRGVFPCLNALELWWPDWADPINSLNSLELANLKLKTLILPQSGKISSQEFLNVVLKTGVEVLELGLSYFDKGDFAEVLTLLRQKGLVLNSFDGSNLMQMY